MIEINSNTNQHFRNKKNNFHAQKKQRQYPFLKYIHFYSIYIKSKSINNYVCVANRKNKISVYEQKKRRHK